MSLLFLEAIFEVSVDFDQRSKQMKQLTNEATDI